jgi:alpha-L-rhamnosidase
MSFNHYAPGSVDDWLYRRVAGIRSTSPGYRTAVIEPDFDIGVDHVASHVGTPYGRLGVEWTRTGDAASVVVVVPFGVSARLVAGGGSVALSPGRTTHEVALGFGTHAV